MADATRRRRVDPHPGQLLRAVRAQAVARARARGAVGRRVVARGRRQPGRHAVGTRRGGVAGRRRRAGAGRPGRAAGAAGRRSWTRSGGSPGACGSAGPRGRPSARRSIRRASPPSKTPPGCWRTWATTSSRPSPTWTAGRVARGYLTMYFGQIAATLRRMEAERPGSSQRDRADDAAAGRDRRGDLGRPVRPGAGRVERAGPRDGRLPPAVRPLPHADHGRAARPRSAPNSRRPPSAS